MGNKKKETKEKPLEKMTATELRDVAAEIPEITGVHGMNKAELIAGIKAARGIVDDSAKGSSGSVREIKKQIKDIRAKLDSARETDDQKWVAIYRRKISRLKKKTRRAA